MNSFGPRRTKETPDLQLHVGRQLLDHVPFQESPRTDAEGSDSAPKPASLWWIARKLQT